MRAVINSCITLIKKLSDPIAAFTGLLVIVGTLQFSILEKTDATLNRQIATSIESERALLVATNMKFLHEEPTVDDDGLEMVMVVKNAGRHVGVINKFILKPTYFINKKELSDRPDYAVPVIDKVVPPIVPTEQATIYMHLEGIHYSPDQRQLSRNDLISGILTGAIPMRAYGLIEYDTGFPDKLGGLGYCFEYIQKVKRGPLLQPPSKPATTRIILIHINTALACRSHFSQRSQNKSSPA